MNNDNLSFKIKHAFIYENIDLERHENVREEISASSEWGSGTCVWEEGDVVKAISPSVRWNGDRNFHIPREIFRLPKCG